MLEHVPVTEAREELSEIVNRVAYGKTRAVLTRRGRQLAALVPLRDLRLLQLLEDRLDRRAIDEALENPDNDKPIPLEQVKKELGL